MLLKLLFHCLHVLFSSVKHPQSFYDFYNYQAKNFFMALLLPPLSSQNVCFPTQHKSSKKRCEFDLFVSHQACMYIHQLVIHSLRYAAKKKISFFYHYVIYLSTSKCKEFISACNL